ncbi:MAG: sigma-70 family RNA polymerase sigma factor [Bdellovibrionales bacterium]|nr:sigma-70 family RNA polymerase sigma factor [Bdellovibrionales bacterium]
MRNNSNVRINWTLSLPVGLIFVILSMILTLSISSKAEELYKCNEVMEDAIYDEDSDPEADIQDEFAQDASSIKSEMDSLLKELSDNSGYYALKGEELTKLVIDYKYTTTQAKRKVIFDKIYYGTHYLIKKYVTRKDPEGQYFDELMQEGYIGLLKAIEKFDDSTGNEFTTYGLWWIKNYIDVELSQLRSTVKLPRHQIIINKKIAREIKRLEQTQGRVASTNEKYDIELRVRTGYEEKKFRKATLNSEGELTTEEIEIIRSNALKKMSENNNVHVESLNTPVNNEKNGKEFIDNLVDDENAWNPEMAARIESRFKRVQELLDLYPDKYYKKAKKAFLLKYFDEYLNKDFQLILDFYSNPLYKSKHYRAPQFQVNNEVSGRGVNGPMTNDDIGKHLGVSRERVRQLILRIVMDDNLFFKAIDDPKALAQLKSEITNREARGRPRKSSTPRIVNSQTVEIEKKTELLNVESHTKQEENKVESREPIIKMIEKLKSEGSVRREHTINLQKQNSLYGQVSSLFYIENWRPRDIGGFLGLSRAETQEAIDQATLLLFNIVNSSQ